MKRPELSGYGVDNYTEESFWYVCYYQSTFNLVTREGFVCSRSVAFLRDVDWQKEDPWFPFIMIFLTATLRLWSLLILWILHLPELCQGCGGAWTPQSELIRAVLGAEECPKIKGQICCSGLPFPPPEDLPDPGIKPTSPALQADSLPPSHLGSP